MLWYRYSCLVLILLNKKTSLSLKSRLKTQLFSLVKTFNRVRVVGLIWNRYANR